MDQWILLTLFSFGFANALGSIGLKSDEVIERFEYPSRSSKLQNAKDQDPLLLEYLVIGRRVSWTEAEALCPSYFDRRLIRDFFDHETGQDFDASVLKEKKEEGSKLATIGDDHTAKWLARRLAESNYRYDGLWIGGKRRDAKANWTWTGVGSHEDAIIPASTASNADYPPWYKSYGNYNEAVLEDSKKNCLSFDRQGHDVPVFVQENCHLRRPFVCQRSSKRRRRRELVKEGYSVSVDGHRYTLYQTSNGKSDEQDYDDNYGGIKKLNGGGVKWRDALLECRKRGQQLALVPTKEAATAVADMMLRSRPSMESVWLGGRTADGTEWTWISSGSPLPSRKSALTGYPPWISDTVTSNDENDGDDNGDYYEKKAKCLILDRHLCPGHTSPAFIGLDCEKMRPFVCQDVSPDQTEEDLEPDRSFLVDDQRMEFSTRGMFWDEGETYCEDRGGHTASIPNVKTLAAVLEKMIELSLDHTWVGGRAAKSDGKWKWVDRNGESLSGTEMNKAWCLGGEGLPWPIAKPELCLNLDREGHGLPLFYGLPCNETRQHVLCAQPAGNLTETNVEDRHKDNREPGELSDVLSRRIAMIYQENPEMGILFVLDNSASVLNAWFVEELKLVAVIVQALFPLSRSHPMGLMTFSREPRVALALNQTDTCHVLSSLANEVLVDRGLYRGANDTSEQTTTDVANAVEMSSGVLHASGWQKALTLYVTDGEHTEEGEAAAEKKKLAVEEVKRLRKDGYEALAIVIGEGLGKGTDEHDQQNYGLVRELFADSIDGASNIFFLDNYRVLADLVSSLNESRSQDNPVQCEQPHWVVPKDDELLAHLLQKK